jgi:hypothetical protein
MIEQKNYLLATVLQDIPEDAVKQRFKALFMVTKALQHLVKKYPGFDIAAMKEQMKSSTPEEIKAHLFASGTNTTSPLSLQFIFIITEMII